jgi:hypothetical protein
MLTKISWIFFILGIIITSKTGRTQCLVDNMILVEGNSPIIPSYTLNKPGGITASQMGYCPEYYNPQFGASYLLLYKDAGGTGMDGYPSIRAGGALFDNAWHPGDSEITCMPVRIKDIGEGMYFELETTQNAALDDDDKWMASINFIFDISGTEKSRPITAERDFDIVVKAQSHHFNDDLSDLAEPINNRFWFFARFENGDLKPYEVDIEGSVYTYAVRYKFFEGSGDKDNKVHVKFIPFGPNGTPPLMRINVKEVIEISREFIQYAALPEAQRELALEKVARDDTWLKGINAGYEVYTGESTLRIDKFKVYPHQIPSNIVHQSAQGDKLILYPIPFENFLK